MNNPDQNKPTDLNKLLADLIHELIEDFDLNVLSRKLLSRLSTVFNYRSASITLIDQDKIIFNLILKDSNWKSTTDFNTDNFNKIKKLWTESRIIKINRNYSKESIFDSPIPGIDIKNGYIALPIVNNDGEIIGIIEFADQNDNGFLNEKEIKTLVTAVVENVSLILVNLIKTQNLQRSSEKNFRLNNYSRLIVENAPFVIISINKSKLEYMNNYAIELLKYKRDKISSITIEKLISDDYIKDFWEIIKENNYPNDSEEISLVLKNRKMENVNLRGRVLNSGGNSYLLYLTEVKTQTNKFDEFTLSEAVKSLNSAVTITDINKNIIYINPAHKNMFGYEEDELIGKKSSILYPLEDPSGQNEKINEAIFMFGWQGERIGLRKDKEVFPLFEKTSVVKNSEGTVIGIVSILDDISARKKLERNLKESEEKHRTLIETAQSSIISFNEKGNIVMFNPSSEKLFGYDYESIVNNDICLLISEEQREEFSRHYKNRIKSEKDFEESETREFLGLKKNGEVFPIEMSFSKCKIEGESIFTIIIFDISQRKNLEEQLIQSAKLAAIGELISGITHEVNNPLAVVMGYAEMLISEEDHPEEIKKIMKVIYEESERARKVIQNLLSFARQHNPEKELVNINNVLEKTVMLTEYDLKKHKITLEKDYDQKLPDIMADPNQLQQVFLNLIINAQQAISSSETECGKIILSTSSKNGSDNIKIIIKDNGPGISNINLKKIFTPFFTTKPEGKGTGLGLSISNQIINKHNGKMYAENNNEGGTAFYIELPSE